MICQNCQAKVDDDLIFCTNCGARLFEPKSEPQTGLINDAAARPTDAESPVPTVLMNDPAATPIAGEKPPKSSSNFKWIALILALIAIPASIFGIYLLNKSNKPPVTQTVNKSNAPANKPTPKPAANQNSNVNTANVNANTANINKTSNTNSASPQNKTEIMNERIEIAPHEHYARPFDVPDETARITGKVKVLQGEKIGGFVYFQKSFDEHFPDETYKVFSLGGSKEFEVDQTLVAEKYVLVFVNDTDQPVVIQGNFSIE
jgi:flagellar basal body-associated protein FliL